MDEILIACGDVDLLRKIAGDLPSGRFKPIATKSAGGIVRKIANRNVRLAIVHEQLADGPGGALCAELAAIAQPPRVLYLSTGAAPSSGPFDVALRYPVPGPVLRNAIAQLAPVEQTGQDLERWRDFFLELQDRIAALPAQNYFGVLGLPDGAPHNYVVAAYDQLSMRYHPDRYAQFREEKWGKAIYEHANTLFQAVTEAFSVLSNRRLRKQYERELAAGVLRIDPALQAGQAAGPDLLENHAQTKQGKKFLKLAQTDIARRDWTSALQNLKFAASMEGDVPIIAQKIAEVEAKLGK